MSVQLVDRVMGLARGVWRNVAPTSVRSAMRPLVTGVLERRAFAAIGSPEPPFRPGPLIVSGFLSESKGISQAARLTIAGLKSAGYAPVSHDLRLALERGPGAAFLPSTQPGGVWIIHCNAPEMIAALATINQDSWRGRYRIGYWAYELPVAPAAWVRAARLLHEIWAPSQFVVDALRAAGVDIPIRLMPHPVALDVQDVHRDRKRFDIPEDVFCVLAMGDLLSSAARKNLVGAIDIYREAFPEPDGKTRLIVKSLSSALHPSFTALAHRVSHGRPDIVFITDNLLGDAVMRLIASSDVVLSPHRSEGFGLTLAEAFLFGVPALATGWSGNLDFMAGTPELLIGHTLVPVDDTFGVYRDRQQKWAEPDMSDAAAKLRMLGRSPDLRRTLAARGGEAVKAQALAWVRSDLERSELGRLVL